MNIDTILDEAFDLYMPQIRSEIKDLAEFVQREYYSVYPYNILEIGTKFGGTFHIWCSINKTGLNISIDMDDGGLHGGIGDEEMNKRDQWFQERFQNCHFIRGNSHSDSIKHSLFLRLMKLLGKEDDTSKWFECIDFLFIDGDHTYEGVKKDFEMYSPFVKKGGLIAFHDIVISDHHHSREVYVGEFWNEIKHGYKYTEFVDGEQNWGGIGVLIK